MHSHTLVISHPDCERHDTGQGHPESPARLQSLLAAIDRLAASPDGRLARREGRRASEAELALVHPTVYIEAIHEAAKRSSESGRLVYLDPDTVVSPATWEAALASAGVVLSGVDAVVDGAARNAFCATRPPGHHATCDRAMGFCFFNNVAVGVRYAQQKGLKRALVIDWDVHHGNGTEAIFYEDPDVYYVSMHQSPHYPGTGAPTLRGHGPGVGRNLNLPVPPGLPAAHYVGELLKGLDFVLSEFTPDIVFVSAGFDAAFGDPLAGLTLAPDDYAQLTRRVLEIAATYCEDRVISALEGGYDLDNLAECGAAHVAALAGLDAD